MIDHLTLHVTDMARSRAFYEAALAPLGYRVLMEFGAGVGMGVPPKPDLWLAPGECAPYHLAFHAEDHAAVRAFHEAALAAGGRDNGPPGLRPQYHPNYYGAFVLDPDGYNIEACCHDPQP